MSMWNMDGWERVTCRDADCLLCGSAMKVWSSLTDPDGDFGVPVVFTEWGNDRMPILRNYLFQTEGRVCEHWLSVQAEVEPGY